MRVRYVWTETPLTAFANPVVGSVAAVQGVVSSPGWIAFVESLAQSAVERPVVEVRALAWGRPGWA
ncbi:hypothetical protein EDD27_0236 [Nonomuraea polychroma]|uniref:Uncharacterized protein n=1 Tax=Nonomuraea polychroma TaxID=46176 RepID=A0A438LWS6_9ACTN|nr:hypothetical protein [Nonomuraea polychroma]RVX37946.1 hypothetical protein EDD27_0236 [Nonomuraea polychroma]